jgi:glucokinase
MHTLLPHTISSYTIALDVGGSSVKSAAIAQTSLQLGASDAFEVTVTAFNSQADAESIFATFAGIIRRHLGAGGKPDGLDLRGVAVGFPGPFDYEQGICRVRGQEKFDALYDLNVRDAIRRHLNLPTLPIHVRNDADVAITGEAVFGSGRGVARVIGVTLGTGLGASFILNGEPQAGGQGVPPNGELWAFPAFEGATAAQRADDIYSIRGLMARLHQVDPSIADIPGAAARAAHGEAALAGQFTAFGTALGAFLLPFVSGFGAEAVLLLGGIANAHALFLPAMEAVLPCAIIPGSLGQRAALLGAVHLFTRWSAAG